MAIVHNMTKNRTPREFVIIKTDIGVKAAIDYSWVFNTRVNQIVHINMIEMYEQASDEYRAFFVYEDLFSKYVVLKPLKELPNSANSVSEIADKLIDIFSIIGAPKILQSISGSSFAEKLERELRRRIPALKMVQGNILRPNYSCRDFKSLVESWQVANPRRYWHEGLHFIQVRENTSIYSSNQSEPSKNSPAEIFFQRNLANDLVRLGINNDSVQTVDEISTDEEWRNETIKKNSSIKLENSETSQFDNNHKKMIDIHMENLKEENDIDVQYNMNSNKVKRFECTVCSKRFKFKQSMERHVVIHTGQKPYQCNICGKKYTLAHSLRRHISTTHQSGKVYKCEICAKTFKQHFELKGHQIVHSNERPFQCHLCGKRFKRMNNLNNHLVIHSRSKSFECDMCKRTFSRKNNLRDHIVFVHTIERPHSCCFCEKRFKRIDHLNVHMTYH